MTNTNSDHWGPEKISAYPLSLKLRTKRSKKLHKYVTQNVLKFRIYFYDNLTIAFLIKAQQLN